MLEEKIIAFIKNKTQSRMELLGVNETPTLSTDLVREGFYDSLSFVDLIADCENEFSVEIDLEKYAPSEFTRIEKLAKIIAEAPSQK